MPRRSPEEVSHVSYGCLGMSSLASIGNPSHVKFRSRMSIVEDFQQRNLKALNAANGPPYVAMLFPAGRPEAQHTADLPIGSIARATIMRRNERRNSMSVASPPDIDVCDGVQEDNNDNRHCHLINEEGLPYCGIVVRGGIGRIHPTNPFGDPCGRCGLRRCVECAELFLSSRF